MEETGFAVRIAAQHGIIRHGYTTYRLTLHCFGLELDNDDAPGSQIALPQPPLLSAATEARWVTPQELDALAMPAAHRKLADKLFSIEKDSAAAENTTVLCQADLPLKKS